MSSDLLANGYTEHPNQPNYYAEGDIYYFRAFSNVVKAESNYKVEVNLPATTSDQLVHGLCVMAGDFANGFTEPQISASSNYGSLTYTAVPNFSNAVKLWGNRNYYVKFIYIFYHYILTCYI